MVMTFWPVALAKILRYANFWVMFGIWLQRYRQANTCSMPALTATILRWVLGLRY